MNSKQEMREVRKRLDDALIRVEVYECCSARREAEEILKENPRLQRRYKHSIT